MAIYSTYLIEFKDFLSLDWSIEVMQDLTVDPGQTTLLATGNPLTIEFNADSDEFNDPLRTSKAICRVYSQTDFQLLPLFASEDLSAPVYIKCGGNDYWQGFVKANEYEEPYTCPPYPVSITAVDGLSLLKNMLFKYQTTEPDDTYYEGRTLISEILINIAAKIGFTGFTEYINIYETNMSKDEEDSPFDQTYVDVDIFKDMYCDEVLQEILKPFNAVIRQVAADLVIYRPTELPGAIVYGRKFTNSTSKSGVSITPEQFINRSATPTDLLQFPNSVLMQKGPAKKITLTQDYGNKESWIDNFELKGETFDGVTVSYQGWTTSNVYPIGNTIPGEKDGAAINAISITPPHSYYISQQFGFNAKASTTDWMGFEFDYLFFNLITTQIDATITFYIEVKVSDNSYYLDESNEVYCNWLASQAYIRINKTSLQPGSSGWTTYKRMFRSLPADGPYTITVYGPYSDGSVDFMGVIKNIKFFASSSSIVMKDVGFKIPVKRKGFHLFNKKWKWITQLLPFPEFISIVSKDYEIKNNINGTELAYEYILGDVSDIDADIVNVIEQFAGAFAVTDAMLNSENWSQRTPGSGTHPILELTGGEIGAQYSRITHFLSMVIREMDETAPVLNLLGCFIDAINTIESLPRKFIFNAGELDVKNRQWTADLLELVTVAGGAGDPETFPGNGWGALYNWYAVSNVHGIAPTGWHVPTITEFQILADELGASGNYSTNSIGGKLKEIGVINWNPPNTDATDEYGFTALPGGLRNYDGIFANRGQQCIYYTSSVYELNNQFANVADLEYDNNTLNLSIATINGGYLIRFIKDNSINTGSVTDYDGYVYPTVKIGNQVWMATSFCGSHYNDGTPINHITDNTAWAADTVGAMCFYGNDIMTLDHIDIISSQPQNDLFNPQPSFQATSTAEVTWEVFWSIRDAAHDVLSTGSETFTILAGTGTYTFTGLMTPDEVGSTFDFQIGKTSTMELTSNHFKIGL